MDTNKVFEIKSRMWSTGLLIGLIFIVLLTQFDSLVFESMKRQPMLILSLGVASTIMGAMAYLIGARLQAPIWARAGAVGGLAGLFKTITVFVTTAFIPTQLSASTVLEFRITNIVCMLVAGMLGTLIYEGLKPPVNHQPSSLLARRAMFLALISGLLYVVITYILDGSSPLIGTPQVAAIVCTLVAIDAGVSFLVSSFLWRRLREDIRGNLVRVTTSMISGPLFLAELNLLWFLTGNGQLWDIAIALPVMMTVIGASWIVYLFVTEPKTAKTRR